MKTIRSLVLLSLAISPCLAQEPNPYLTRSAPKATAPPAGDSFLSLVEHVIVPSNLLDSWLAAHSMAKDASGLRAAAQKWIEEGTATIASTALTAGTVGRDYSNESIVEQIYACEYMPPDFPDEWPFSTSFETRNCGYSVEGNAIREQGDLVVRAENNYVAMLPHRAYDRLSEQTRQPDDIFIPRFRSVLVSQSLSLPPGSPSDDPFAYHSVPPRAKSFPSYPAGKTHLALRVDEDLPEPAIKWPLEEKPQDEALDPLPDDRPVRLIFVRSDKTDATPEGTTPLPADYQLSVKFVSVDHHTLSTWLQDRDLAAASRELGEAIETWNEDDKVTLLESMSGAVRKGPTVLLEDDKKLKYPTEWEQGKREPTADGKSTQLALATGESLETRDLGIRLQTYTEADGSLIVLTLHRVLLGDHTIHHRVLREGEWIPDVTFPRFASNRWNTSLRVKKGEWLFVGASSGFGEKGLHDPSRTVLAFVKAD